MKQKHKTKWLCAAASLVIALFAGACGGGGPGGEKELLSIAVKSEPDKKEYAIGTPLDPAGLVVEATYSDGTKEVIANDDDKLTISPLNSSTPGERTITVSYEGKTATFTVTVKNITVESIALGGAYKTTYFEGDSLDLTKLVVTVTYSDDSVERISNDTLDVRGFDSESLGEHTITVAYGPATADFTITVKALELLSIAITSEPGKKEYYTDNAADGTLDLTGLVVEATYNNGTKRTINSNDSGLEVTGFDFTEGRKQTITVTYREKTAAFEVTVYELSSITITKEPAITRYIKGQALNLEGLVVEARYTPEKTKTITDTSLVTPSGFDTNKLEEQTITVTYKEKEAEFEIVVCELNGISITGPTKKEYFVGDIVDSAGLVVTATYSDGATEPLTNSQYTISPNFNASTPGTETVIVSYGDKTANFTITVIAVVVESIEITSEPAKKVYYTDNAADGALNLIGLVVEATYNNGRKETITDTNLVTHEGFDLTTGGSKPITVTYEGKNAKFTVTVFKLSSIVITTKPAKLNYLIGEPFNRAGLVVTAAYNAGAETKIIDNSALEMSGFDSASTGEKTITVTYKDQTAKFTVTVYELSGIVITQEPGKTEYFVGDEFDTSGLVVTATYSDGIAPAVIANNELSFDGFNSATEGTKTVKVTYGGKEATFTITVNAPAGITLTIDDIVIVDEGKGVFDAGPVVLSKSGTVKSRTFTFSDAGSAIKGWNLGDISMGSGGSVTLNASAFNPNTYTLTLTFTKDGISWLANLDFTVTE